jgi:hypothetical protein
MSEIVVSASWHLSELGPQLIRTLKSPQPEPQRIAVSGLVGEIILKKIEVAGKFIRTAYFAVFFQRSTKT